MYLSAALVAASSLSLCLSQSTNSADQEQPLTMPYQLGPYPVRSMNHELRTNRSETLAPNGTAEANENRRLMLTIYQPVLDHPDGSCASPLTAPLMPPATGAVYEAYLTTLGIPGNGTLSRLSATYCSDSSDIPSPDPAANLPVILISHGLGGTRLAHQTLGPALASSGNYTVITIDHTYDSLVVEFTDGTLAQNTVLPNLNATDPEVFDAYTEELVEVRVADVTSVLDAVQRRELPGTAEYPIITGNGVELEKEVFAGIIGHSLGGATASAAILSERRILGGINMDGRVFEPALNTTAPPVPFVLFAAEHDGTPIEALLNTTWVPYYEDRLTDWKRWLRVLGTQHLSFCDFQLAVDVLGMRDQVPEEVLGTISGDRLLEVEYEFFGGFFQSTLYRVDDYGAMEEPQEEFTEVEFVRAEDRDD